VTERRPAVIIIAAAKGDVRAARGLASRAINAALGNPPHYTEPFNISYMSAWEAKTYDLSDPRYTLDVTDAELERIIAEARRLAEAEGWTNNSGVPSPPIDVYHD